MQLRDVADGLAYLHAELPPKPAMVHGNVRGVHITRSHISVAETRSQENVLIAHDGRAVLSDFGITCYAQTSFDELIVRTASRLMFWAPELLRMKGAMEPTSQSDVYAFGMLIYQVCPPHYAISNWAC